MEAAIAGLLRAGVVVAAATVLFGGVLYLSRHGFESADYRIFQRVPYELCHVRGILENSFSFHGRGYIQLGLLLLIATPIARVFFSIISFARQRDTPYVLVTLLVFGILIYSLMGR